MKKVLSDEAWEEYLYWQTQDKKIIRKINNLIKDIDRNVYHCTGKPEQLSENLAGFGVSELIKQTELFLKL